MGLALVMRRACPRASLGARFGLALLGAGLHVFMDLLNSYGVELFYPISSARFELAWTFIIDLAVWAILLAPLLLSATPAKRLGASLYRASAVALALYIGLCGLAHARAEALLARSLRDEAPADFTCVFPEALGPHRFRGVARNGSLYRVWLVHVLGGGVEPVATVTTDADLPEVQKVRARPEAQRIERFFKAPVWRLVPERGVAEVTDLRFSSTVLGDRHGTFKYEFPLKDAAALKP
jgi:hypothetical protein